MNNYNLKGRVAVVTGGAQGFGYAITKRLLESGAEIIIWDKIINDELQSNVIYESVNATTLGIAPPPPTKKSKHRPTRNNGNNGNNGNIRRGPLF